MGLTSQSTGINTIKEMFNINAEFQDDFIIALAGNPNTGKSTVFNNLTGLNQHTGNWPGKTVTNAQGRYKYNGMNFVLVDLPGTYSIHSSSVEEEVARDFICFGMPHATIIVADATCLERNLNLVLQIMEITDKVVLCVNLLDEANRKKIKVDLKQLSLLLGIPVIGTSARNGKGINELVSTVYKVAIGEIVCTPHKIRYPEAIEAKIEEIEEIIKDKIDKGLNSRWLAIQFMNGEKNLLKAINNYYNIENLNDLDKIRLNDIKRDEIPISNVDYAAKLAEKVVIYENDNYDNMDRKIDDILTSKLFGIPSMLMLLGIVFWITIKGANYPSTVLSNILFGIEAKLSMLFQQSHMPEWIHGILILGMYRTLAWVISVMLPPMAIFFPLFTLLEDLGYLPRVAFNLDNYFKKACAHGKQALTMCMGFGCNAAGVIGCRIIDSPRERLIAIITNFFVPCNGRFPILIAIATIFISGSVNNHLNTVAATLSITGVIVFGVVMTLLMSKLLSKTILKGVPSSFTLELPPYRKPQIGSIMVRSILDRTIFVLGRAITVAAPAGAVIWLMANITAANMSLLDYCAHFLQPFAALIGIDGYILMAFILGLPANEIVMPIIIMSYMSAGTMIELDSLNALKELLIANGWTWITAINVMLFCLMHFPCATTLLTIKKETQSWKWTAVSFLLPTLAGIIICFIFTQLVHLLGIF